MAKYKIELKPIRQYGFDFLPEERKQYFKVVIGALAELFPIMEGVSGATVTDELALIVEAENSAALEKTLGNLHKQTYITKLE